MFEPYFQNRTDAGRKLADDLTKYVARPNVIVLALPRGGVPVAFEVARELRVPMDIFIVRKLGVPGHEEMAMGAIASSGVRVLNRDIVRALRINEDEIQKVAEKEQQELTRREQAYRGNRPQLDLRGCTVILVDDGLATGASMQAAVEAVRQQQPQQLIIAVPVASPDVCESFREMVDEIVCFATPEPFYAVGLWYRDFSQTTDLEVQTFLEKSIHFEDYRK